jgi:uncharacterized protein YaaQ
MRLITAIINKDDGGAVQSGLTSKGFSVTRIATTGGFLKAGNITLIIGLEDERVDEAIEIISELSRRRLQEAPPMPACGVDAPNAYPIEVSRGGATIFVQDVERFEKI